MEYPFFILHSNLNRLFYGVHCLNGSVNLSDFVKVITKLNNIYTTPTKVFESRVIRFFDKEVSFRSEYIESEKKNVYLISKKYVLLLFHLLIL